jgi:ribosomal protein S18 acetylase RimI-like enzyme
MTIHYKSNFAISAEQLADVFDRSGIRRPTDDLARLQKMIDNANLIVTAWDSGKLVGVGRALTDFCYCCYLSDLAVDRVYQKQGIGRELVRQIREAAGEETTVILLSAPDAMTYYPKIGLEPITNGWMIKRSR